MESTKSKARQVFNSYNGDQPPVYAKADASHQLSFVPSLFVCIPAMFRTWMLLLIIVAGYGLFTHTATDLDSRPALEKHAQAHARDRTHNRSIPISASGKRV